MDGGGGRQVWYPRWRRKYRRGLHLEIANVDYGERLEFDDERECVRCVQLSTCSGSAYEKWR